LTHKAHEEVFLNSLLDGLVVKEQSGFFWVEVPDGSVIMCRLRGRLMEEAQSSDIAAIGDRVKITVLDDGSGSIEEVAERESALSRSARTEGNRGGGQAEREHVIIANADLAFFVFAAAQPAPSFRMLDRFLVSGEKAEIDDLTIVVNKIDLDEDGSARQQFETYREIGYPVLYTSALQNIGVDELRERLKDHISVFTGPSGVGKTSLLNTVQPGLGRSVKSVSRVSQEGIHTTRDSELVKLDAGGYLADTPGLRQLAFWDVEPEELDAYFREIAAYVAECRFGDCTHQNEPGCAVRAAVEAGKIKRERYDSYLSLRAELEKAYATY
jgi:ribosome biogenesis GTPase / thiamine phosphate phosphatase